MLIDSHCHLNFPELRDEIPQILKDAFDHNVKYFLTVNTRLAEYNDIQKIADDYPQVFCSVGVHPHDAKDHDLKTLENDLLKALDHPKTVALGETGLDYYYNNSPAELQKKSFDIHTHVAKQKQIPLIIHTRDADDDTIDILKPYQGHVTGVFHCFSGDLELVKKALDLGFYISFSGIITFKKATALQEVVQFVPLNRILVETDSPFLAPIPMRGKPNKPAYTRFVAQKVSDLKQIDFETIQQETTANFKKLFNKTRTFF